MKKKTKRNARFDRRKLSILVPETKRSILLLIYIF